MQGTLVLFVLAMEGVRQHFMTRRH
jgi:hypothetical protein